MSLQSGSTLRMAFLTSSKIAGKFSSSASRMSFCVMKTTAADSTPLIFLIECSMFAAQWAQQRFSSLYDFFMVVSFSYLVLDLY